MENKRNNTILTFVAVATLLVAVVGASFAYFSATGTGDTQNVASGELKVAVTSGSVTGASIKPVASTLTEVDDLYASSDVVKLPVTVTTTGTTVAADYDISMTWAGVELDTEGGKTGGSLGDIKWMLISGTDGSGTKIDEGDLSAGNGTTKLTTTRRDVTVQASASTAQVDEYTVLVYITDTGAVQDQLQGLSISATASVEAKQK